MREKARVFRVVRCPRRREPRQADRRYYRLLKARGDRFRADLDSKLWCDMWHTHFDWDGFGSLSALHRRRHIRAMLRALSNVKRELADSNHLCQSFALIYPRSSADDALYVHTPNPKGAAFPVQFQDCIEIGSPPPFLMGCVDLASYRLAKHRAGADVFYSVQPRSQPSLIGPYLSS